MNAADFTAAVNREIAARVRRAQSEYEQARAHADAINANVPAPITSMDDAGYWEEKYDEIRDEGRYGGAA